MCAAELLLFAVVSAALINEANRRLYAIHHSL
jgi:hypothetical protein